MVTPHPPYRKAILPPPGPSVHTARTSPSTSQAPSLFKAALHIRLEVFIKEQGCSADEEIDADDASCWHWIIFAPLHEGREEVPAATIRLVPASKHDHGHDVVHGAEAVLAGDGKANKMATEPNYGGSRGLWDGEELFVKIGRLATLREFRGKGFGKVLVREALDWAGKHAGEVAKEGEGEGEWKGLVLAHAQMGVEKWYRGLGFERDEGMGLWWEEGIEHVGMWKRVDLKDEQEL